MKKLEWIYLKHQVKVSNILDKLEHHNQFKHLNFKEKSPQTIYLEDENKKN